MIEHELKFALTASMQAEFEQRAAIGLAQAPQRLWSQYFDTPDGDLMAASATLRVRRTPGGHVQTVKAAGRGAFERYEWEAAIAGSLPEVDALPPPDHPVGSLLRESFGLLAPVFETDFERQVRLVRPQPGVTLEIACDQGEIRCGQRRERVAEVEIECKEGSAAAFYHYATQWAALHQAQLLLASKALRGLQLAGRSADRPSTAELQPRTAPPDARIADAAQEMLGAHLEHLVANLPAVLSGTGPDAVRQLYVALRRFRAAIRFLGLRLQPLRGDGSPAGDDCTATWQDLEQRARTLGQATLPVRQSDACEAGLLAGLRKTFPEDAAIRLLSRALMSSRECERAKLRQAMASPDLTAFVLRAHAAVAAVPCDRWPDQTFAAFSAGQLAKLARRAGRRVRRARRRQFHRAGVAVAHLRWALEACRALQLTAGAADDAVASLAASQSSRQLSRQLARARLLLIDALTRTHGPAEATARAVALLDGCLACARWLDDPQASRDPLLATIRRVREAQTRPQRGGDSFHGDALPPRPGNALDAMDRQALRLSS